jgi:predicted O-methyltransferase YrrM
VRAAEAAWGTVDAYLAGMLVAEDTALAAAREAGRLTTMPMAEVTAAQGKFLALLCQLAGASRVLEFGTLAGYSTIWLARAVGPGGLATTLELEERNAAVARPAWTAPGLPSEWRSWWDRQRTPRGG